MYMSNFLNFDFNINYFNIIDNLCEKEKYTYNNCDIFYLINKYNDDLLEINKNLLYYCIGSCIVNKIHNCYFKNKNLYKLFIDISNKHINLYEKDKGLYYIFEGLIQYNFNYIDGINQISEGVELLRTHKNDKYLSSDFLYGSNLIKKIPSNFFEIDKNYNDSINNNFILYNNNINTILINKNENTNVYINFTTDVIYFMAFFKSFIKIFDKLYLTDNISQCGIFWNIIIDKNKYEDKKLMNKFIINTKILFEYFKNKNNSIIITTQVFNEEIKDKSLFTTYRFINMYKYLQITKTPIIQSDIDFDNLENINQFIQKISDFDIGLFRVKSTPWRKICATLSYFSNEQLTYEFSYVFGVFLNYFYVHNSDNWFIDQLCLSLTENYLNCNLNAEHNICSIYKFLKNTFNYSTIYKNNMLDNYNNEIDNNIYTPLNIYVYWNTGINNSPKIVKKCIETLINKNPDHNVYILDDNNLFSNNIINIKNIYDFLPDYDNLKKKILPQSLSDIIRLFLLYKYSGIWIDSTCFCNIPLSHWLNNINNVDFFAFRYPGTCITPLGKEIRLIDNWFLYSNNSYIIDKWFHKTIESWNDINVEKNRILYFDNGNIFYFWVHYLFNDLYNTDFLFKNSFDKCANITVDEPQYLTHVHHKHKYILDELTNETKSHIDNYTSTLYKLTWKFDENIINKLNVEFSKSILFYLFSKDNIIIDNYK